MERSAAFVYRIEKRPERPVGGETPVCNGRVDPRIFLVNDSAGPEVEMPHLAVTHLSFGQPDGKAAGRKGGGWVVAAEPVDRGGVRLGHGVEIGIRSDTPAVHNDKDYSLIRHIGHRLRLDSEVAS